MFGPKIQRKVLRISALVGLDRTEHMSFPTGQDRTPKFAGRVLPDRTKFGPTFFPSTYQMQVINSIKEVTGHEFGVKS